MIEILDVVQTSFFFLAGLFVLYSFLSKRNALTVVGNIPLFIGSFLIIFSLHELIETYAHFKNLGEQWEIFGDTLSIIAFLFLLYGTMQLAIRVSVRKEDGRWK